MIEKDALKNLEIEPRSKVLILSLIPDPETKAHLKISAGLVDASDIENPDLSQIILAKISSPEKDAQIGYGFSHSIESGIDLPESLDGINAIVISGSPYNMGPLKRDLRKFGVDRPEGRGKEWIVPIWLKKTVGFIREAHERDIPMLGICAGAQLISESLGGRLERLTENGLKVTEKGWGIVRRLETQDPLFDGVPGDFVAPLNHMYTITRMPPDAEALAESRLGLQAFRVGRAWGLQFHPEKDPAKVEEYYNDPKTQEKYNEWKWDLGAERSLSQLYDPDITKRIMTNFMKIAWTGVQ